MNYFLISPILKATIVDLILDLLYLHGRGDKKNPGQTHKR